jgi:hypothetical protein
MAPEGWQKLAIVIDQGNYPVKAIQDAVWCLSNNHSISAITDQHPEKVELLRRTVAKIKGIEVPWYTIFYEAANEEHQLFSDKHERLTGDVNYFVNSNSIISMVIKNQNGQVMKQLVKGNSKNSGSFIYSLDLSVVDWPKGEYTIYIYEDYSNLNKKVVFKL